MSLEATAFLPVGECRVLYKSVMSVYQYLLLEEVENQ
jgi:hypothetical protein